MALEIRCIDIMGMTKDLMRESMPDAKMYNHTDLMDTAFPTLNMLGISYVNNTQAEAASVPTSSFNEEPWTRKNRHMDRIHANGHRVLDRATDSYFEGLYNFPKVNKRNGNRYTYFAMPIVDDFSSTRLREHNYGRSSAPGNVTSNYVYASQSGNTWSIVNGELTGPIANGWRRAIYFNQTYLRDVTVTAKIKRVGNQSLVVRGTLDTNNLPGYGLQLRPTELRIEDNGKALIASFAKTHHFHLTSTVADGTVKTTTANDLNTCSTIGYKYNAKPESMEIDIRNMYNKSGVPQFLQEWGDYWSKDSGLSNPVRTQAEHVQYLEDMYAALQRLVDDGILTGFNYWRSGWGIEGIITNAAGPTYNYTLLYNATPLQDFFNANGDPTGDGISVDETALVSVSQSNDKLLSVFDAITVTENKTITVSDSLEKLVSVSDTVTITESVSRNVVSRISTSDTTTATENISSSIQSILSVSDSITVTEIRALSVSSLTSFSINVIEDVDVIEAISVGGQTFTVSTNDTVSLTESVTLELTSRVSVSDAVTAAEARTIALALNLSIYERLIVGDDGINNKTDTNTTVSLYGGTSLSLEDKQEYAQSFTAMSASIKSVQIKLLQVGVPTDDVTIKITSSLGGAALAVNTIASDEITSDTYNTWVFPSSAITTVGNTYYFEVSRNGNRDTTHRWELYTNHQTAMFPGIFYVKTDGIWGADVNSTTTDLAFSIDFGDNAVFTGEISMNTVSDSISVADVVEVNRALNTSAAIETITVTESAQVNIEANPNVSDSVSISQSVALNTNDLAIAANDSVSVLDRNIIGSSVAWVDRTNPVNETWFSNR